MPNISMKQRIGIVLSVVWLLAILIICPLFGRWDEILIAAYIGYGVLPVVIGWGIWWIIKGRATTKPGKDS